MTTQHHVPEAICPVCEHPLDGATNAGPEEAGPAPGDITVCIYCGSPLFYIEGLKLQKLTDGELDMLPRDVKDQLLRIQWGITKVRKDSILS